MSVVLKVLFVLQSQGENTFWMYGIFFFFAVVPQMATEKISLHSYIASPVKTTYNRSMLSTHTIHAVI